VVRLSQGLAQAKCEGHFTIGQVAQNLAGTPLAGRQSPFRALRAELVKQRADLCRSFRERRLRVAVP
jgi:hypothetical protein